jgi:CheY-like chemotaxis protein
VLLDIGMPGVDGYEACRRIRARHGRDITLIAVSGWGQESDKQLATSAGFDAHVTKPADPETLAQTICRHSARH